MHSSLCSWMKKHSSCLERHPLFSRKESWSFMAIDAIIVTEKMAIGVLIVGRIFSDFFRHLAPINMWDLRARSDFPSAARCLAPLRHELNRFQSLPVCLSVSHSFRLIHCRCMLSVWAVGEEMISSVIHSLQLCSERFSYAFLSLDCEEQQLGVSFSRNKRIITGVDSFYFPLHFAAVPCWWRSSSFGKCPLTKKFLFSFSLRRERLHVYGRLFFFFAIFLMSCFQRKPSLQCIACSRVLSQAWLTLTTQCDDVTQLDKFVQSAQKTHFQIKEVWSDCSNRASAVMIGRRERDRMMLFRCKFRSFVLSESAALFIPSGTSIAGKDVTYSSSGLLTIYICSLILI